jgi:hypothetical protein
VHYSNTDDLGGERVIAFIKRTLDQRRPEDQPASNEDPELFEKNYVSFTCIRDPICVLTLVELYLRRKIRQEIVIGTHC